MSVPGTQLFRLSSLKPNRPRANQSLLQVCLWNLVMQNMGSAKVGSAPLCVKCRSSQLLWSLAGRKRRREQETREWSNYKHPLLVFDILFGFQNKQFRLQSSCPAYWTFWKTCHQVTSTIVLISGLGEERWCWIKWVTMTTPIRVARDGLGRPALLKAARCLSKPIIRPS